MKLRGSGRYYAIAYRFEKAVREIVRKFFVPYPEVDSFKELNEYLHQKFKNCLKKFKLKYTGSKNKIGKF